MKQLSLILCIFLSFSNLYCQFGPKQDIANDADGAQSIVVADIDGDGFLDVVSSNKFGDSINWYKHLDGEGAFGPQMEIDPLQEPIGIDVADLDGDGDMDVLGTAPAPGLDQLMWYENMDGAGDFSFRIILFDGDAIGGGVGEVLATDLDGDGDMDIIGGSNFDGVFWFRNEDGQGTFSSEIQISTIISVTRSVFIADLDGDLDLDIVANGTNPDLVWFENLDGLGNFSSENIISPPSAYVNQMHCADLDGDGDLDIATVIPGLNIVAWHENTDGQGTFGAEQIISGDVEFPNSIFAADLDNDLDFDLISTSGNDNKVAWYENLDGLANFSSQQIISTKPIGPKKVVAADLDSDGDLDVFTASVNDNTLSWYENLTILGKEDYNIINVELVPNPVKDILFLTSDNPISLIEVYDVLGNLILSESKNTSQIDVGHLPSGLLFFRVENEKGVVFKKVVKQ